MENKKKCELWSDNEVKQMLILMKKSHFAKISNETETYLKVYEAISTEMAECKMHKTASQVRDKINELWLDFVKLEKNKDYSKAGRHAIEHFDLLEEIFSRNKVARSTLRTANENTTQDPLLGKQFVEVDDNSDEEMIYVSMSENETSGDEDDDIADMEEQVEEATVNGENASFSTDTSIFNDKKCRNYKKVIENFTKDWKSSQRSLLENLKRQDSKDLRNITKQYKKQESLLQNDRQELEKILEKDRQEMKNILDTFLKTIVSNSLQNGVVTAVNVKEENEDIEFLKSSLV